MLMLFVLFGISIFSVSAIRSSHANNEIPDHNLQQSLLTCDQSSFITFVMPTSGVRKTVVKSIESIRNMTDCNWRLIITYPDHLGTRQALVQTPPPLLHVLPTNISRDPRIYFLPYQGSTSRNFGGLLRNIAFPFIETEWVGFLDDDDSLTPDYIDHLRYEAANFQSSVAVVFRMSREETAAFVVPWGSREHLQDITFGRFGISFAVQRKVLKPVGIHEFVPGDGEDFKLLADLHQCNSSIVVSNKITYLVKGHVLTPNQVKTWIGANTSFALPGLNTCDRDSIIQPFHAPWLGFTFPESDDLVYQSYIAGLKQALKRTIFSDCVDAYIFSKIRTELHFHIATEVSDPSMLFVQVILDHSFNIVHYSAEQMQKLKDANQVWATTPSNYRFLTSMLELKNVLYVPAWNFVDMEYNGVPAKREDRKEREKFLCSHPGGELWIPHKKSFWRCNVVQGHSCDRLDDLPDCVRPSVLYYGSLSDSPRDKRLQMVNTLQEKIEGFGCFRRLYGPALDMVVSTASIVVLPHLYDTAIINFFLARGKVIVALQSGTLLCVDLSFECEG